jgi:hypothetical protein
MQQRPVEASVSRDRAGQLALGCIDPRCLISDGQGLARLALMVGTVFDRLTGVEGEPSEAERAA